MRDTQEDTSGFDEVERPLHYNRGAIEVRDFIADQALNFNRGNVVKYVCRAGFKFAPDGYKVPELRDLQKARDYLDHEIEQLEASQASDTASTSDITITPITPAPTPDERVREATAKTWEEAADFIMRESNASTRSSTARAMWDVANGLRGGSRIP